MKPLPGFSPPRRRWPGIVLLAGLALLGTIAAYQGTLHWCCPGGTDPQDSMAWLRNEYRLDAAQVAAITALQEAHATACERHCSEIREHRTRLAALAPEATAERGTIERQLQALDRTCRGSIADHARRVAAVIGGERGQAYLGRVLPRLESFDHEGAPGLDLLPPADKADEPAECHGCQP